jgi:hypothetical protein
MFRKTGDTSSFLSEFYVMDVILNRSPVPNLPDGDDNSSPLPVVGSDDRVVMVKSYLPEDADSVNDYKFRTMVLFLPQCGVFYCARERRSADVGVLKTLVALDMSWLRLTRLTDAHGEVSYTFGDGGYVKRLHSEGFSRGDRISAWHVSSSRTCGSLQNRLMYRVGQCLDCDGPMMAPDVFAGERAIGWPHADLAEEYNGRLARANSARKDGRHYAPACHHFRLPDTCWIIDPTLDHFVDIIVDLPQVGMCEHRQSIVMVRNVLAFRDDNGDGDGNGNGNGDGDGKDGMPEAISCIAAFNRSLQSASPHSGVRAKGGDVGKMHAIGTHVELDGVTTSPYRATGFVERDLLRSTVVSLARIGRSCFPQVYSVIRDTEGDSGLQPVAPMDGEGGQRVGYTIDTSVDLGNASHFDIHDASQGFSVWTEEFPGRGTNWYFVMPNLHGRHQDGREFFGVAVRLTHGVAISWDGRVIRHCTSLSQPDGPDRPDGPVEPAEPADPSDLAVSGGSDGGRNHLYGTFTSAKERVVAAGRALSAARALVNDTGGVGNGDGNGNGDGDGDGDCDCDGDGVGGTSSATGKRRRKRRRKRKRR